MRNGHETACGHLLVREERKKDSLRQLSSSQKSKAMASKLVTALAACIYLASAKVLFQDKFTEDSFKDWVTSNWKGAENMGKWEVTSGEWYHGKQDCIAVCTDTDPSQTLRSLEECR